MKKSISVLMSILMLVSVFSCLSVTASAVGNPANLFSVSKGTLSNGEITFTVSLKANTYLSGAVIFAEYDASVLSVKSAGPVMTKDSYGDPTENVSGMYEAGKAVSGDNLYSVGYIYGKSTDYNVGSSDKKFIEFTFKVKDASKVLTSVKFICYDYSSVQKPSNNIPNGSMSEIATLNLVNLPKVVLSGATIDANGIKVSWNEVKGADGYIVYRKTTGGWSQLECVKNATSYVDGKVSNNVKYSYTVRPFVYDSNKEALNDTGYDSTGVSYKWLKAPANVKAAVKTESVTVTWDKVSGASSYNIYRREVLEDGKYSSWVCIKSGVTANSYADAEVIKGTKLSSYQYTVRAVVSGGGSYNSNYPSVSVIPAPTVSAALAVNGVKVTWSSIEGADKYNIYKSVNGGSWKGIAYGVTSNSYLDTSVTDGQKVAYTVRASVNGKLGQYVGSKTVLFYKAPTVSLSNASNGITVKWSKSSSAKGYYIYRKTEGGSWSKIATVKNNSTFSYTDTKATPGTKYYYTVRMYNGSNASAYYENKSIVYLKAPTLSSVKNSATGVTVKWSKVAGAKGYYVYRKTTGGWSKVGTVNSGSTVSFTDTTAKSGTKYTYTVKAYNGSSYGTYDKTGKSVLCVSAPNVTLSNASNGVTVKWSKVTGATNYIVYRKTGSGGWAKLYTAKSSVTSYTDKTAVKGTAYYYTVKAVNGKVAGGFVTNKSIVCLSAPKLSSVKNSADGVTIKWTTVAGAKGYYVYRKTTGGWSKVGTVNNGSTVSFTDTTAKSGTKYTYTVKAYNGSSYSTYDSTGKSVVCVGTPVLVSAEYNNKTESVNVVWEQVEGATSYYVYRKTETTGWTKVAALDGTATSYADTLDATREENTTYIYTVKALAGSVAGGYDATGLSVLCETVE
ncbi:MAG: hypothetical protein KIG53_07075 [Oscillospiraceae bacterium]|nr:hypothetical protein [Oscillospiraceae bacterium]